jgi:hypothetical protein
MEQASARCCVARMKRTSRWIHLVVRVRHGIRTHPPENALEKKFYCNFQRVSRALLHGNRPGLRLRHPDPERARLLALGHPLPASSRRARARTGFPEHSPFFFQKEEKDAHVLSCPLLGRRGSFRKGLKKVRNAGAAGLGCGVWWWCGVVDAEEGGGNPLRGT